MTVASRGANPANSVWMRLAIPVVLLALDRAPAQYPCPPEATPLEAGGTHYVETEDFVLSIESASGAVGDVVGVSILLHNRVARQGWPNMTVVVCHDPEVAEPVGSPRYTDELVSLLSVGGAQYYRVDPSIVHVPTEGHGFFVTIELERLAYDARFPSEVPMVLMTVYYRIKGAPGDVGQLAFCDGVLKRGNVPCLFNNIHTFSGDHPQGWEYFSNAHVGGTLTVLDGPATHPARPPEPPLAKVYPDLPSDTVVNFRVRIEGASARPGAREVPIEVYASADLEYSGILIPIDFDERYLRLARAEDHFQTGIVLIRNGETSPGPGNEEGNAVVFSGMGVNSRRLAAEGEEVHAATLYFDVLESASEVPFTRLEVAPVVNGPGALFRPWIGVHHLRGLGTGDAEVRSEVDPISIRNGVLALRGDTALFLRGDSNGDRTHDLSDVLATLSFLFLGGGAPWCVDAADANDDGRLDIADPVASLEALFLGAGTLPEPAESPGGDPTADPLGC